MLGGNKRSYVVKQKFNLFLQFDNTNSKYISKSIFTS